MTILITGAEGFIGRYLCKLAAYKGLPVRMGVRIPEKYRDKKAIKAVLDPNFDWSSGALKDISVVVHLAAKVHSANGQKKRSQEEYERINNQGTINLARQAACAGVKRFVFLSSIGVNGPYSTRPLTEKDAPRPAGHYEASKLESEKSLGKLATKTDMEVVIIRPPLVYGPEAPGNFGRLVWLVQKELPLPFALVRNKRSFAAIDNLADLIFTCIYHPAAPGQIFLVSDGEDLSTPELIRRLARAMGRRARLFPLPPALLKVGGQITGKTQEIERLTGSLQVDISHTCETLGWRPPVRVDEGLEKAVGNLNKDYTNICKNRYTLD